MTQGNSMIS